MKSILPLILGLSLLGSAYGAEKHLYLDAMNLSHFQSGWGKTSKNKAISGKPLTIAGQKYERGIGTHAEFNTNIALHETASRFQATVGLDDACTGRVEFIVKLDGEQAWSSGIIDQGEAKNINLDLSGSKFMELIVTDGNNTIGSDHANWCDAKIIYVGKAPKTQLYGGWQWITPEADLKKAKAALIPYPTEVKWSNKKFISRSIKVLPNKDPKSATALKALQRMAKSSDVPVELGKGGNLKLTIKELKSSSNKEAYELVVSPKGIHIQANDASGLFYGVQTLRQLTTAKAGKITIPCCEIKDSPAFPIRGFMHDVGRNFINLEELKRQIDIMSLYKLNYFHFHPTENEAYRVESKKYPALNKPEAMTRWEGKYYTAEDIKELIAFCKERQITVLPELDMPGHSAYFDRVFGFGMQSDDGVRVLKELVDEWVEMFDCEMFHLGTDEVKLTRKTFVAEMTEYIRSKGKKTLSWHHGLHPYDGNTIHQLWNAPREKNPIIDSRGYVNTDDPIMIPRNYFLRQYCDVPKADEQNLGGILCYWPDEPVVNEDVEMRIAPVYPAIVAFSERIWQGNPNSWPTRKHEISYHTAPPINGDRHRAYTEFEKRLSTHRDKFFQFKPEYFQFVENAQVKWSVIGPFPNKGDVNAVFPPEKIPQNSYTHNGQEYTWEQSWGGTLQMADILGVQASKEKSTHTGYALTHVYSPKDMQAHAWINFSRKYLAWPEYRNPDQGHWACAGSKIWINDKAIKPPKWEKPRRYVAPVTEESYVYRKPHQITLKKGWNKVLIKSPNLFTPWTVSFLPLEWDGQGFREIKGLKYSNQPTQPL